MEYVELHDISMHRLWDARRNKNGLILLTLVGLWGNYAKTVAASVQINFSKKIRAHSKVILLSIAKQSSGERSIKG